MLRLILPALALLAAPASAQSVPPELPARLEVSLERPDAPNAHLSLTFERTPSGGRITGCQTNAADVGCNRTRTIALSPAQLEQLAVRWRHLAAGVRCRVRRPSGHWTPFRVTWSNGRFESLVFEHADARLNARCFASERVGGWFLRIWRES